MSELAGLEGDKAQSGAAAPPAVSAGALLREARQARGLHIAALASAIKVSPAKLDLLENDRFDELPGASFTRALAQTVCRSLKIDAAPVMALLPQPPGHGLEQMSRGLNAPFHDRPTRRTPGDGPLPGNALVWVGVLLVALAALLYYVVPENWLAMNWPQGQAASGASVVLPSADVLPSGGASEAAEGGQVLLAPSPLPEASTPSSSPTHTAAATAEPVVASAAPGASTAPVAMAAEPSLQLQTQRDAWVEVADARYRPLLSRIVRAGETVNLQGALPLRLKIGKASAVKVVFKGQGVDLAPHTSRDDVARLELR
jgi:cytoskeleton protein RodZ